MLIQILRGEPKNMGTFPSGPKLIETAVNLSIQWMAGALYSTSTVLVLVRSTTMYPTSTVVHGAPKGMWNVDQRVTVVHPKRLEQQTC